MKKCTVIIAISVLILLILSFFIGTGFRKRDDVILLDYSVSEDGSKMTFNTAIASSTGYTRGFDDKGGGVRPHYLVFYSAFGGLNGSLGAKSEFELELGKEDTEIYFNRADGGYEPVLKKNTQTGEWERP